MVTIDSFKPPAMHTSRVVVVCHTYIEATLIIIITITIVCLFIYFSLVDIVVCERGTNASFDVPYCNTGRDRNERISYRPWHRTARKNYYFH
jgi:hypothetical protein